jgi:hypothetical protein
MYTYKITYLLGKLETSVCPPTIVSALFPDFAGEAVTLTDTEITVTFDSPKTPVYLGPLVKVELI